MLEKLRHTLKHSAVYSIGNLSTKLIGLVLLPLYLEKLTTTEYGILAILEVSSQFIIAIFSLRLSVAMMRWYVGEKDKRRKGKVIFTTFSVTTGLVLLVNILLQPFTDHIALFFFDKNSLGDYFTILIVWSSIEMLNRLGLEILRLKERSGLFIIATVTKFILILLLNFYFLLILKMGVKGIILSQMIGSIAFSLSFIPIILRESVVGFIPRILGSMLRYSIPLVFSTISMTLLTISDRYLIKFLLNESVLGIYNLGYKLAGVLNLMVIQSFQLGFLPIAYKLFDKPDSGRYFSKVLTYLVFVSVFLSLVLSLFSRDVLVLFTDNSNFWIAYTVVPLICLGFVFKGIQNVFALGLHFVKKTRYNAWIVMVSAAANIGLNFLLIPILGIYGAAINMIITMFLMMTLFYYFAQKFYKINYELGKLVKVIITGGFLYGVSLFTLEMDLLLGIVIKLALLALFPVILYFWKFYEEIELLRIAQGWKKWRDPRLWKSNITRLSNTKKE